MKKIFENKQRAIVMALIIAGLFLFQGSLMADGFILNHTGTLQVTNPAGVVSVIVPTAPLPNIVSGSKIQVTGGSVEIAPAQGFIQLLVGGSVVTVKAGDKVKVSFDPATGKADFTVEMGSVLIVTGNTTTTMTVGQQAIISLNKVAGIATVQSITGDIKTVTVGVTTMVPQGSTSQMSANAKTRNVHVESTQGTITVTAINGTTTRLNGGQVLDTAGAATGEIQTFEEGANPTIPHVEEARQPLRVEGSAFTV